MWRDRPFPRGEEKRSINERMKINIIWYNRPWTEIVTASARRLDEIRDPMRRARLRTIFSFFIKLTSLTRNPSIYTSGVTPLQPSPHISTSNCVVRVFKVGLTIMTNLFRGLCGNDTNYMHFPVTMRTFNSIRGLSLSRLGIVEFLTLPPSPPPPEIH